MKRRDFMKFALAGTTFVAIGSSAQAADFVSYKPGLIQDALAAGKTVFVDYAADWCTTCKSQERTISKLRAENKAYEQMMFVRVDWDEYSSAPISTKYKIPRRSTLLVLKGDQELGRIVAGTSKSKIKALMDTGLTAATS